LGNKNSKWQGLAVQLSGIGFVLPDKLGAARGMGREVVFQYIPENKLPVIRSMQDMQCNAGESMP